jgi:hypothetical protein
MMKEFPSAAEINEDSLVSGKNRSFLKIMQPDCNNVLLNTNISVDNQQYYLQEINNFVEGDDYISNSTANINTTNPGNVITNPIQNNRGNVNDNISLENLQKVDFKKCFYKQPSQMALGRKEGNLALSSEIDTSIDKGNFSLNNLILII